MASDAYLPRFFSGGTSRIADIAECLIAARPGLRGLSSERVCAILGEVHAEWAAPRSRLRREAVECLYAHTGYARATLDRSLHHLFGTLTETALYEWVQSSTVGGQDPVGPPLVGIVAAGNLPGTAIPSLIQALLLRSTCLVKSSSAEPHLMPLYAQSLSAHSPELANAVAVLSWPREDETATHALLQASDALIAYGSDATLESLRHALPAGRPFIGYGHRISFSVIGRSALKNERARETARKAALDVAVFDQQGCLSPQAIYVQRGGEVSPRVFASLIAGDLERLRTLLPRHPLTVAEAAAIHQYRAEFEMSNPGRGRMWHSKGGTDWTAAIAPIATLRSCPLNRTAVLHPFERLEEIAVAAEARRGHLISCGSAVNPHQDGQLRTLLSELGVSRFCKLGEAQFPSAEEMLNHDGVNAMRRLSAESRHVQP